jgi:CYTH domain-containing protein
MADEIELELTYLAKHLPEGLAGSESKEVQDIYIPKSAHHPKLRIRKSGEKLMITKKEPTDSGDYSVQVEHTIPLTREEFGEMSKLEGKRIRKTRYLYKYKGRIAEVDVFKDGLEGLVVVDFEFSTAKEKDSFVQPEFCLAEVTQEEFIAGGTLCGKTYSDIEKELDRFGYKKITQVP